MKIYRFATIALLAIMIFVLVGCDRPATRSSWSLINETPAPSETMLASTLAATSTSSVRKSTPTPIRVPTLDLNSLPAKYPLAFKGYELVSWQQEGDWVFVLLSGTNRSKSFEEILAPENRYSQDELVKIMVLGTDQLKTVLGHLSKGEQITWGGMDLSGEVPEGTLYFAFPPDEVVADLISFCQKQGITLVMLKEN